MILYVNGDKLECAAETINALIEELEIVGKVTAAAVNMNVVKKDEWDKFGLKEGDKVELLRFVGGG